MTFNKTKLVTIFTLPIMWLFYCLFEVVTGNLRNKEAILFNLLLTAVFAITGYIIYILSQKYENCITTKNLIILFFILMLIDQGIKIIIKLYFIDNAFYIINDVLSFNPMINSQGSWLNARFDTNVSFAALIIFNIIGLFLFFEGYKYYTFKGHKDFDADMAFIFLFSGALCSLIDKVFYGGSLDFIGISSLFVADIKDIYICLSIFFFIVCVYKNDYLKDDKESNLKSDWIAIKSFFIFIKNDIIHK